MVLIIANIVTGLALKSSKPSSVNPRVYLFISSFFSPPRGQLVRKKQIQIMAEPMGKLKSNLLLFALAFGEEGRAGGLPRSPQAAAVQVGGCRDESLPCPRVPSVPEVKRLPWVQALFLICTCLFTSDSYMG